jgi:hypothetical protein
LAYQEPDAHAQVAESDGAGWEVVVLFEDGCEGREEEIKVGIYQAHVDRQGQDDRREEQHFDSTAYTAFQVSSR